MKKIFGKLVGVVQKTTLFIGVAFLIVAPICAFLIPFCKSVSVIAATIGCYIGTILIVLALVCPCRRSCIKNILNIIIKCLQVIVPLLCDIIFVLSGILVIAMVLIFIEHIFQPFASCEIATSEELIQRMGEIKDSLWQVLLPTLASFMAAFIGKEFLSDYKEKINKIKNENLPSIKDTSKKTAMSGNYIGTKKDGRKCYLGVVGQPAYKTSKTEIGCEWDNTPQWEERVIKLYEGMDPKEADITREELIKIGKGKGERLSRRWNYIYSVEEKNSENRES